MTEFARPMTKEQKTMYDKLTALQKRIAMLILTKDGEWTFEQIYRAARPEKAEYMTVASMRVVVDKTRKNPKVAAFISSMQEATVSKAIMEREEALERLSTIARGNFADLVDFKNAHMGHDEDGDPVIQTVWRIKDSALMDPEQLSTISELTAGRGGLKIKLHSQTQAIQQLAAMQGWTKPVKLDHSSSDGSMTPKVAPTIDVSKLSTDTLKELMAARDSSDADE